jgi:hypothetical protein
LDRYVTDPARARLEDAATIDRYNTIIRHVFDELDLTAHELAFIADVLTETPPTATSFILSLDDEVAEAVRRRGFRNRWLGDPARFTATLRALTTAQKFAIVEGFERGWFTVRDRDESPLDSED